MPTSKSLRLIATAFLGSAMMIGTAAAMASNALPQASKQISAKVQDVRYQPGSGWHRWGPWGWRHRWSGAKQGAKDR
jgi:hypothetical protein